jgi:hypothetical protein
MSVSEFLRACSTHFAGKPHAEHWPLYREKLAPFTGPQLDAIYNRLIETEVYFPKIKVIYDAARALGYFDVKPEQYESYHWTRSACRLCGGEGRLLVLWKSQEGRKVVSGVWPYSHLTSEREDEFRSLFRCACPAGDALPKTWPRWRI